MKVEVRVVMNKVVEIAKHFSRSKEMPKTSHWENSKDALRSRPNEPIERSWL